MTATRTPRVTEEMVLAEIDRRIERLRQEEDRYNDIQLTATNSMVAKEAAARENKCYQQHIALDNLRDWITLQSR